MPPESSVSGTDVAGFTAKTFPEKAGGGKSFPPPESGL